MIDDGDIPCKDCYFDLKDDDKSVNSFISSDTCLKCGG